MTGNLDGFQFRDPTEYILFIDDTFLNGTFNLHSWQIKVHTDFAQDSTDKNPYQAVLRTCNGAGKDRMVIAPCATWLCMRYPYTTCVVTTASGQQLDRQTNKYIQQICEATNAKLGQEIWKINYRHYENLVTKSTIELFVTDESGRAEGWHPVVPNAHLAIFTSEAKSIPEEIFHALARCTGFTKRLDCSTPGLPMGHFFNRVTSGNWTKYHITAYECPHLSTEYIEQCRVDYGGEASALFKSMVLAEFGTTDELVVIPYHKVWNAIHSVKVPWKAEPHNIGGLDLAAGGDETVLAVRNGNKLLNILGFKYDDTQKTIERLEREFKANGLQHSNAFIFGDAGGLGKPILDQLRARGWHNIRYVLNQSSPKDGRVYVNRGAELWFTLGKWFENGELILLNDERLKRQLSTRYYKQTDGNKLQLESKLQARAKGHPSPDRADATVLAFSNYKSMFSDKVEEDEKLPLPRIKLEEIRYDSFTLKQHAKEVSGRDKDLEQYYGGRGEQRKNVDELRRLIDEFNEKRREQQKELAKV